MNVDIDFDSLSVKLFIEVLQWIQDCPVAEASITVKSPIFVKKGKYTVENTQKKVEG